MNTPVRHETYKECLSALAFHHVNIARLQSWDVKRGSCEQHVCCVILLIINTAHATIPLNIEHVCRDLHSQTIDIILR